MSDLLTVLTWLNLALLMATLGLAVYGAVAGRARCSAFVPSILWAALGVAFYGAVLAGRLENNTAATQLWSAIHRTVGAILILGITVVFMAERRDD